MTWWTVLLPKKFLSTLSLRRATPAGGCRASGLTFLSTLSLRRATCRCHRQHCPHSYFYPRSPCGERRLHIMIKYIKSWRISIHALLAESDNQITLSDDNVVNFYPRSPCGERPHRRRQKVQPSQHFYPRSPCGERHAIVHVQCRGHGISIHALLAESDLDDCVALIPHQHFYPRSPCGERPMSCWNNLQVTIFLSTLSLRRATAPLDFFAQSNIIFLSTLSLRRATAGCMNINPPSIVISIHALLAESDRNVHRDSAASRPKFLSTLSLRRATAKVHKTVGYFCAYETNFMGIASSC